MKQQMPSPAIPSKPAIPLSYLNPADSGRRGGPSSDTLGLLIFHAVLIYVADAVAVLGTLRDARWYGDMMLKHWSVIVFVCVFNAYGIAYQVCRARIKRGNRTAAIVALVLATLELCAVAVVTVGLAALTILPRFQTNSDAKFLVIPVSLAIAVPLAIGLLWLIVSLRRFLKLG